MLYDPTPRQAEVLWFIARYRREHAVSPTYREIADHLNVSTMTACDIVTGLRRRGLVIEAYGRRRAAKPSHVGDAWLARHPYNGHNNDNGDCCPHCGRS